MMQRSHDPSAKGGFFAQPGVGAGSGQNDLMAEPGQNDNMAHYLNKTQVIVDNSKSSVNERANRINLHRSNR